MTSAPSVDITFCGRITLPNDLDILRPFSSTVKPCVSTPLYGAREYNASDINNEEWNQPRCWSEPSRYNSTGGCTSSGCVLCTHSCDRPESAQTSMTSTTLS